MIYDDSVLCALIFSNCELIFYDTAYLSSFFYYQESDLLKHNFDSFLLQF